MDLSPIMCFEYLSLVKDGGKYTVAIIKLFPEVEIITVYFW